MNSNPFLYRNSGLFFRLGAVILCGVLGFGGVALAGGNLDSSFGRRGLVVTDFNGGTDEIRDVALQADTKIVALGRAYYASGIAKLARYNPDGSLDTGFGTGGKVTINLDTSGDVYAMVIRTGGEILVAGYVDSNSGDIALLQYTAQGILDSNFGVGGMVLTDFGGTSEGAQAVSLLADGKILVAGGNALVRYTPSGGLDTTFGSGGRVLIGSVAATDMVIQGDGKILVAGDDVSLPAGGSRMAVWRFQSNGDLDSGFGQSGKITSGFYISQKLAVQTNGRIVVAGSVWTGSGPDSFNIGVARFDANGNPDASFGVNGRTTTVRTKTNDYAFDVALQSDGKIVLAGYQTATNKYYLEIHDILLARYKTDGSLDSTFGGGGIVTTNAGSWLEQVRAVAIQADGRIVAGGFTYVEGGGTSGDFLLLRYNP